MGNSRVYRILEDKLAPSSSHQFHIPVMGTGFTIDTPLKIAQYGISSAVSLVDDVLVEQMRQYHCAQEGEACEPIVAKDEDSRARRITAYLNLLNQRVKKQLAELRSSPFEEGSAITRYFSMLPNTSLRQTYESMLAEKNPAEKMAKQDALREQVAAGGIDVNIMTKLDRDTYKGGEKQPAMFSDALSALRGFAKSTLHSAIVFSAGINTRLYNYMAEFEDFFPNAKGELTKKIIIKVSDFRSAVIQGKYLAKRGLWISEFRIESGLNCGGHAFATNGHLLGPILEEFKDKLQTHRKTLFALYCKALEKRGREVPEAVHETRVTVQGGVGTADEHSFLMRRYNVAGTGWGTPFLMVPEVIRIDGEHIDKLCKASEKDVYLSPSSPLGVPFWNLRTSASEEARRRRIREGKPGSHCPKGYIAYNNDFTSVPLCISSRAYQKKKLDQLAAAELSAEAKEGLQEAVLVKSCICHDLAANATKPLGIDPEGTAAICAGPNIVNFKKSVSLDEMVGHIYGRLSVLASGDRPHMFIKELSLYIDHLRKELDCGKSEILPETTRRLVEFKANLLKGVDYYQQLAEEFVDEKRVSFLADLRKLRDVLEPLSVNC